MNFRKLFVGVKSLLWRSPSEVLININVFVGFMSSRHAVNSAAETFDIVIGQQMCPSNVTSL